MVGAALVLRGSPPVAGQGSRNERFKILADDGEAYSAFGYSVAASGATLIVGAPWDSISGRNSGSAYHFDDAGIPALSLNFSGDCPGRTNFTVSNATPGRLVAIVYGLSDGPTTIPDALSCAGTILHVGNPSLANRIILADARGVALLSTNIPAVACSRLRVQALDTTTCAVSGVVRPD